MQGIFWFAMGPENSFELNMRILELPIEVGTRITVLTNGLQRFSANHLVKTTLENLWQCDEWLRKQRVGRDEEILVKNFVAFVEKTHRTRSSEYSYVHKPFISNLLSIQHVFINSVTSQFSKDEVINQLATAHAHTHNLDVSFIVEQIRNTERTSPMLLWKRLAIAHATMERNPRISIVFGTYPNAVFWTDVGDHVKIVCIVLCAKDAYGTWRDCLKKMSILCREQPNVLDELVASRTQDEFLAILRQAELSMVEL